MLLFVQDEQDENDEELQSDAFQVGDAAFEDEQQSVIDVDDDDSVERMDLTDLEEPTTQHVDSYDMDTQEDFFGSISGMTTIQHSELSIESYAI